MPNPGEIWRDGEYYPDPNTGEFLPKFLLVVGVRATDGDVVYKLLTSKPHGRPQEPLCFHGTPYPGYFLGLLMTPLLPLNTWVDLRESEEYDRRDFEDAQKKGRLAYVHTLQHAIFTEAARCVAAAPDTLKRQRMVIQDLIDGR
jgi:hypothetical protein